MRLYPGTTTRAESRAAIARRKARRRRPTYGTPTEDRTSPDGVRRI